MAKRIQSEKGSGNVFADIGLPNPEEALAKAEIARQVNRILVARKLSQAEAGVILGIAQPRVSDLIRGRLGRFSLDKLIDFAKRSGNDVEIRIKPSRRPRLKVLRGEQGDFPGLEVRSHQQHGDEVE
jgi:predicted XRE-type DNA-binding protein